MTAIADPESIRAQKLLRIVRAKKKADRLRVGQTILAIPKAVPEPERRPLLQTTHTHLSPVARDYLSLTCSGGPRSTILASISSRSASSDVDRGKRMPYGRHSFVSGRLPLGVAANS